MSLEAQNVTVSMPPKNIIIMIGDGMGFEHINATMFYCGNQEKNVWNEFPVKLAASTSPAGFGYDPSRAWREKDYIIQHYTESAAAATAIATGFKTTENCLGLDANGFPLMNLTQLAEINGKATGIVTSVPFCHATPAGFSSHQKNRRDYGNIAVEMLLNTGIDVIMGCGHPEYDNDGNPEDTLKYDYFMNASLWHQINEEKTVIVLEGIKHVVQDANGDGTPDKWSFSDQREYLEEVIIGAETPSRLLFIAPVFETLAQERSGVTQIPFDIPIHLQIPTLQEMTEATLKILNNNKEGFFLMVEGGAIDWASHENDLPRMIEEQILFENTIQFVMDYLTVNNMWDETLLIVLADHECGYLTGGWSDSTGFVGVKDMGKGILPDAKYNYAYHTNHLIPFFAKGCYSNIFASLAADYDSVRGYYLDISDVHLGIQNAWGITADISPKLMYVCSGQQCKIQAYAPAPGSTYQWYVNDIPVIGSNSFEFVCVADEDFEVFCVVRSGGIDFTTHHTKVKVEKCN